MMVGFNGSQQRKNARIKRSKMRADTGTAMTKPTKGRKSVRTDIVQVDKDWFQSRMTALGIRKFAEIARKLGIERSMFTKSLHGERAFTVKDVLGLAAVLQTSPDEICRRIGYDVPMKGVPIVGTVRDDGMVSSVTDRKGQLFQMLDPPDGAQALVGQMNSAALSAYNGATFVHSKPITDNTLSLFGQLCVVEAEPHVTPYLGTLTKGSGRGKIALETLNGKRIELIEIHRVSPVILIYFP
jgi:transcriptional regulator with XRE-family HTH domain